FIRKRERAALELKRRDVFEAYIEEVAIACKSLKKGKLDEEKLKKQLAAIAKTITGGEKTDEILKKKGEEPAEPAGESTIIITPEGAVGAVPEAPAAEAAHAAAPTAAAVAAEVKEDQGTKRAKAAAKPEKKEKGHGKGKR